MTQSQRDVVVDSILISSPQPYFPNAGISAPFSPRLPGLSSLPTPAEIMGNRPSATAYNPANTNAALQNIASTWQAIMMPQAGIPANAPTTRNPWVASAQSLANPNGNPMTLYTLKNGHRILIEQRPTDIIGLRTFVDSGSIVENALTNSALYRNLGFPSGIAHLDEHCHFLSTQNFPQKNAWSSTLEKLGANTNASTSDEEIQHQIFCNKEDLGQILRLHTEMLLRPRYNAADIEQEKRNVINENLLKAKEKPFRMHFALNRMLFDRTGRQTLGTIQDVATTLPEQLRMFTENSYTPKNMVTVISGNVDPEQVLGILGPEFGTNPNQGALPVNEGLTLNLKPGEVKQAVLRDPQWTNSTVQISFPGPKFQNVRDQIAMDILLQVLSGGDQSCLAQALVQSGQAYSAHTGSEPMKLSGLINVTSSCKPGNENLVRSTILNTIQPFSTQLVDPTLFNNLRKRCIEKNKQSMDTVASSTENLGEAVLRNNLPYLLNYEAIANSLTPTDLMRVAREYLDVNRYAVVYAVNGPKSEGDVDPV